VRELIEKYAAFNPHATFSLQMPDLTLVYPATAPGWSKWRPSDPTSPFWYEIDHLTALIAAYLNRERAGAKARTLREFVAEFYGLSASAKQKAVLEIAALPRRYLHDLVEANAWRAEEPERLLEAMRRHAKRVNPKALGVLGRDHLSHVLCEQHGCEAETVSYKKVVAETSGLPFVLEVACGVYRAEVAGETSGRVMTGINWSATLTPPFEHLGTYLNTALVQQGDPVVVVVHLAIPRPTFRDRGKQALTLPEEIE
jgi:DNA topoisomerase VI subunit B